MTRSRILHVDLASSAIWFEALESSVHHRYPGGSALASYLLLRELKPGVDPLGDKNVLVFAAGLLNGTGAPGATKFTVAAKSPLTEGFAESEAGGRFGAELRAAGLEAIVITGRADTPVYLWIRDRSVELKDAAQLWELDTGPTQQAIREQVGDRRACVALTGPAGRKRVRYACILNDLRHVNGRTGMGAVMGSKNLAAIVVKATGRVDIDRRDLAIEIAKAVASRVDRGPGSLQDLGTAGSVLSLSRAGLLPSRNFRATQFEGAEKISGQTMKDTMLVGRGTCYVCSIRCKREVQTGAPYFVNPIYGGPEYETIAALGSLCGIDDLEAIAKGSELCNRFGLDTISTGAVIAFAMECHENGLLSQHDTRGIDLRFGNAGAMLDTIKLIAAREGVGDLLAEGVKRASTFLGPSSEPFALHVKGQELPMHEPRGKKGVALAYAVSPTGADHLEAAHDPAFSKPGKALDAISALGVEKPVAVDSLGEDKVYLFVQLQKLFNLYNSLGMCNMASVPIGPLGLEDLVQFVNAATGWDTNLSALLRAGERVSTMARVFNLREGLSSADDWLPSRLFEAIEDGPNQGKRIEVNELRAALVQYYEMQGWDTNGMPTARTLENLELSFLDHT